MPAANDSPQRDVKVGEVVFLGTGTSVGVPALGCNCDVCLSDDPRDNRTRCAIVIGLPSGNLLIDTPPDLRSQLLRERIGVIHAVAFTHSHADHLFGLDDLRLFPFQLGHPVPLYCEWFVERRIRHSYDYCFLTTPMTHSGARPQLEPRRIAPNQRCQVLGTQLLPIRLFHGTAKVLGFRFGDFAYCTDTNHLPDTAFRQLQGVKTLVLDALRYRPHPTHFHLDAALQVAAKVKAESTYLTHISHDFSFRQLQPQLPDGVRLAYDGLRVTCDLTAR